MGMNLSYVYTSRSCWGRSAGGRHVLGAWGGGDLPSPVPRVK